MNLVQNFFIILWQPICCLHWGLRLKTEDMAKFGQLFLQKGNWNGKQILPASWIEEASTLKIYQAPDARQSQKDSSDWMQGYCYQMLSLIHISEPTRLGMISYAVFCLKKKNKT